MPTGREAGCGRPTGHLGCVDAQILKLILDQAAVAIGHVGDLLDPCQVHWGVRLCSNTQSVTTWPAD